MRAVDLAVYADTLAAKVSELSARLERARQRIRRSEIEHEARRDLPQETVATLERLGVLERRPIEPDVRDAAAAVRGLAALEALQGWVESRLSAARLERPEPGGSEQREEEPMRAE